MTPGGHGPLSCSREVTCPERWRPCSPHSLPALLLLPLPIKAVCAPEPPRKELWGWQPLHLLQGWPLNKHDSFLPKLMSWANCAINICVFPQCLNLLSNNRFTKDIIFIGCNSQSTCGSLGSHKPGNHRFTGSFISMLITNVYNFQVTHHTS